MPTVPVRSQGTSLQYYISTGENDVFYTLCCRAHNELETRDYFVCNLSLNKAEAVKKANAHLERFAQHLKAPPFVLVELDRDAQGVRSTSGLSRHEIQQIEQIEAGFMPFGKWKGRKIAELPSGYLLWMLENLKNSNQKVMTTCAHVAFGIASERNLLNALPLQKKKQGHLGVVGDRLDVVCEILSSNEYRGKYGIEYKYRLRAESGETLNYRGVKYLGEIGDLLKLKVTISYLGKKDDGYCYTCFNRPEILQTIFLSEHE